MISGSTVHYRCAFDVRPVQGRLPWPDIPTLVKTWIASKAPELSLDGRWFFEGGQAAGPARKGLRVQTIREVGGRTRAAPAFWSARFDHPDRDARFREWRTDIGFAHTPEAGVFSLLTRHWIRAGHIGEEPAAPVPSAPGLVGRVLRGTQWRAFCGSVQLADQARVLKAGHGDELKSLLEDGARLAPVVLVTRRFEDGATLVDATKLARLLAGVAIVIVADSPEVNKELEWILPKAFRCWDGQVRVYQPRLRLNLDADSRRHRFFLPDQIASLTAAEVETMLVTGIVRRSAFQRTDALSTIEDVVSKQREYRLFELRKTISDEQSNREYIELLEQDNAGLRYDLAAKTAALSRADSLNDDLQQRVEQALDQAEKAGRERDYWRESARHAKDELKRAEDRTDALSMLRELPRSLPAALDIIGALFAGRIAFTDRARRSSRDSHSGDLHAVWRCLWEMATVLFELFFEQDAPVNVVVQFKNRTGFEMAMTEGGTTRAQKDLMKLRRDKFEGREIDIEPHVKIGSDFRIHFHHDREQRRIIVGHCGDHLTTAGTRRKS